MNNTVYHLIFDYVKKIPKGKVVTYGYISDELKKYNKNLNGHVVGWILHKNKSSNVPCHRVVDRSGRLAPNFGPRLRSGQAFSAKGGPALGWDGAREQKRRLESEGVTFVDDIHVDLEKHLWIG